MSRLDDYGLRGLVLAGRMNSPHEDRLRFERTQAAMADYRAEGRVLSGLGDFYLWLQEDGPSPAAKGPGGALQA